MSFLREAAFPYADGVAAKLIYVFWIPFAVAFVILSVPTRKSERLLARLARASYYIYFVFAGIYLSYFILNPNTTLKMFVMATQMVLIPTTIAVDPIIWLWQGDIALMADVEMMYSRQRNVPRIFDNKVLRLAYYCSVSIIDVMTSLNGCFGMGVSLSLYLAHLGWLTVFDTDLTLLALVNLAVLCVKLYAKNASVKYQKVDALREEKRREEEQEERRLQEEYEKRVEKIREELGQDIEKSKEIDLLAYSSA